MSGGTTLTRHIMTKSATAIPLVDLALIMERIELIAKRITRHLAAAGLGDQHGYTGDTNVQGEKVKKLDEWGNQVFLDAFEQGYPVSSLISEEMDEPHHYSVEVRGNSYCVLYDPIDGSSNTDVNGSLGTIFAVKKRAPGQSKEIDDILSPGTQQVVAGYVLYGPATQLIYTAGAGVDIFTLDRTIGEFILWNENVKTPPHGSTYAVNQANASKWHEGARKFLAHITSRKDKRTSYSLRYSGALAADFHRCLLEGGIYMYPGEVAEGGKSKGKLRLLYELAPLSMLAEQAGGRGSTGEGRLLEVAATGIHERHPIYIGSAEEVALAESFNVEG
ncbi:MAG: class 1 fructose-bisphosphatase [Candidatus Binatus sp.]